MYRSSAYDLSQSTLIKFARIFNTNNYECPNIYCCPIIQETMKNDGYFVDVTYGKIIGFDWEIRRNLKSFKPGVFQYPTLTEFERKFEKSKRTKLFIQCDSNEEYIAVAWRDDFKICESRKNVATDEGSQSAPMRETENFYQYNLNSIAAFRNMLAEAIQQDRYTFKTFN